MPEVLFLFLALGLALLIGTPRTPPRRELAPVRAVSPGRHGGRRAPDLSRETRWP